MDPFTTLATAWFVYSSVVTVASELAKLTESDKDDKFVGKLAKPLKDPRVQAVLNVLARNKKA